MCGIAGVITNSDGALDATTLDRMSRLMRHRGPDDLGFYTASNAKTAADRAECTREARDLAPGQVALVHRRLSILDPSSNAGQPMLSPCRRLVLAYNGEVYNFVELRDELRSLGHQFESTGDSAVLLAAFREWGPDCLPRLRGMFAFAVLDRESATLHLCRDHTGMKPLYAARWSGGFAFASEIKPLLELPGVDRDVHPPALHEYLRSGLVDHDEATMFAAVRQIPPASHVVVDLETAQAAPPASYWTLDPKRQCDLSRSDARDRLRQLFLDSVHIHLRSDVPVAATLSGGIDSSAIVAAARRLQGDDREIQTFSYVASDPRVSEEHWIDITSTEARTVRHKVTPDAATFWDDVRALIEVQEQPFGSPSVHAQNSVMRTASEHGVKVLLSGQGADEIFAGYRPFFKHRVASYLRQGRSADARRFIERVRHLPGIAGLGLEAMMPGDGALAVGKPLPATYRVPRLRMYRDWTEQFGAANVAEATSATDDPFRAQTHSMLTRTSLPHLLRYEDRNSMAWSIESRLPFLDLDLIEFACSLPEAYVLDDDGTSKAIFREALDGIAPAAVLQRRDKLGFPTPDRRWLTANRRAVEDTLLGDAARRLNVVDVDTAMDEWTAVVNGITPLRPQIWRWLNVILWAESFNVRFP